MKIDKSTARNIIWILLSVISFIVVMLHLDKALVIVLKVIHIFMPVILGLCLAFIINPLMNIFETKVFSRIGEKTKRKGNGSYRGFAILLSYIVAIGIVSAVFLIAIPQIREAFVTLSRSLPDTITHVYDWFRTVTANMGITDEMTVNRFDWSEIITALSGIFELNSVNRIFSGAIGLVSSIFGGIFNLIMAIAISIHVLINKERISRFIKRFVLAYIDQNTSSRIFEVVKIINESFRNFITGQLTEAVILGFLCFIGMTIFRFPFSMAVSSVVALTAMVPVLGAWIGGAVGAVLAFSVSPMKAIFFILYIIILQQLENNLIYPRVVGKSMNLPGLLILVAVLVGGSLAGVVGMLFSVPLCSIIYTLLKQSIDRRLKIIIE